MEYLKAVAYDHKTAITVLINPDDPHWVHPDGQPSPADHTGDTQDSPELTICKDCRNNWRTQQFNFHQSELVVYLNKFGNPVRDDQEIVSSRIKAWDDLYDEIDARMGQHVIFADAPRQDSPAVNREVEPEFEYFINEPPTLADGIATQKFHILRRGEPAGTFIAEGADSASFAVDRDANYITKQTEIVAKELVHAEAMAIVDG